MYKFKIESISVSTTAGDKTISPKSVNVIIGPNNSGKSRFLKEIRNYLSGQIDTLKIIKKLSHQFPGDIDDFDLSYGLAQKLSQDMYGNWMLRVYSNRTTQELDMNNSLENYHSRGFNSFSGDWRRFFGDIVERRHPSEFFDYFGSLFFQYVGTEERLLICKAQRNYGLDSGSLNFLSSYKFEQELLGKLAENVRRLFNKDILLDTQTLGDRLVFRVGENFDYARSAGSIDAEIASRLNGENRLDDQGDGLKSYVSTFLSLNNKNADVLLIDEPEAFLHPPLARQLGELIGESETDGMQIYVATHSVEVLKGILSKCQDVNIIRITQPRPGSNEIHVINNDLLRTILHTPLLRVSRVMEGLFCEKVVITESEADELVYQELIEKLFPQSGLYFAHGQNKQTLVEIAKLYKELGISYEMITDFDVLRIPSELSAFLNLMPLDDKYRQRLLNSANKMRQIVNDSVNVDGLTDKEADNKRKAMRDEVYHKQGVAFFSNMEALILKTLDMFSGYHLHILQSGELETVLIPYGVPYKSKKEWISDAINRIEAMDKSDIPADSVLYKLLSDVVNN